MTLEFREVIASYALAQKLGVDWKKLMKLQESFKGEVDDFLVWIDKQPLSVPEKMALSYAFGVTTGLVLKK